MKNFKPFLSLFIIAIALFVTSCGKETVKPLISDLEQAEEIFGKHLTNENGVLTLTETDPVAMGIDPAVFDQLVEDLKQTNEELTAGDVNTTDMNLEEVAVGEVPVEEDFRGCGKTKVKSSWSGVTVYLSSSVINWLGWAQCGALGLWNPYAGIACGAIITYVSSHTCNCGIKAKVKWWGAVSWVRCQ